MVPTTELVGKIREIEEAADAARAPQRRLSEQERVRHAKLDQIRAAGMEPYALGCERTDFAADIRDRFPRWPPTRTPVPRPRSRDGSCWPASTAY